MDRDEPVQPECPLALPTSILKYISDILQYFLPLILSTILGNKCEKCISSVVIILVRLDWISIDNCSCFLLNIIMHFWVVFPVMRVSMGGTHDYLFIRITMIFILWFPSRNRRCHTRHSIQFAYDIKQQDLSITNSPIFKIGKKMCPLGDWECLDNIWHIRYIISLTINHALPLLSEALDDLLPLYDVVDDGYSHCIV